MNRLKSKLKLFKKTLENRNLQNLLFLITTKTLEKWILFKDLLIPTILSIVPI